jgi:enoyl-CoA hydratase
MNDEISETESLVTYHREQHVGFITLNRPDKRNALNSAIWNALDRAISAAEEDVDARVVVLSGAGKSFCTGLDLSPDNELLSLLTRQASASQKIRLYREIKRLQAIYTRLERLSAPTIASIHAHCLGAGLELALCCDMRVCTEDTVFSLSEAKLAVITDVGGLQRLPKVVSQAHAREIVFRGHRFDAAHAEAIGLVNAVYADKETCDGKALEVAREIAANSPLAVQGAKEVFLFGDVTPAEQALDFTAARSSMIMPSKDIVDAVSAYFEKRGVRFEGA